jgi:6-phosphogluconolactonase
MTLKDHWWTGGFRFVLIVALGFTLWGGEIPGVRAETASGAVYAMTNQASGNAIAVYQRAPDGSLTMVSTVATGGLGTGSGLGSEGSIVLSENGRWLVAVNAGSNEISAFRVEPSGLALAAKVSSGGTMPISVTVHQNLIYVLNAGGTGNIAGFTLSPAGQLTSLAGSIRPLSASASNPAQVSFSPDGSLLVVTEKATNLVLTYAVDKDGLAAGPTVHASSGTTPFGFAFADRTTLVVSEAFGGAANASALSSYRATGSTFSLISPSVPTGQTAACWVVVTPNGKFAYTTNAGSHSISAYAVGTNGSLTLLQGIAGDTGVGTGPADVVLSGNGQYLYTLSPSSRTIVGFAVQADGSLTHLGSVGGLPAGAFGLAAR